MFRIFDVFGPELVAAGAAYLHTKENSDSAHRKKKTLLGLWILDFQIRDCQLAWFDGQLLRRTLAQKN